jgi:hypothetical protein
MWANGQLITAEQALFHHNLASFFISGNSLYFLSQFQWLELSSISGNYTGNASFKN